MSDSFLNLTGLRYYHEKLKALFATKTDLDDKVDKVSGKGLSTNDYTTTEKNKLSNIAAGAQVNVIESVKVNGTAQTVTSKAVDITVPTKLSDLSNDGNFVTDANYVHTDNNYTTAEKNKLSGIAAGAQANVIESIKVNGTAQTITSKAVDITVPTKLSDLTNDNNFVTDADYVHTDSNYTAAEKTKLAGVASGAEVNQNAFSNIKVGSTTVAADSKTDTVEFVGSGVTITADATNDKITFTAPTPPTVDSAVSKTSTNAIQNKAITSFVDDYMNLSETVGGVSGATFYDIQQTKSDGTQTTISVPVVDSEGILDVLNLPMDTSLSSTSTRPVQNKVINSALANKANLASPTFTGTPKAPTAAAGTNTEQIATTQFVTTAVANAIGGVTSITYKVVTTLPATGENGVIYLVAHSHGTGDGYDEYIWVSNKFEKLGNTDVDLSGYMLKTDMVAITTAEIDTLFA